MIDKEKVVAIVENYLAGTACFLVDLGVTPDNRITVEIDSFDNVSIDFCADLSRHVEANLDRDVEDYELEVGSAGLTSPFKIVKQYEKNKGNQVEVLTCDGRKLRGLLKEVMPEHFVLEVDKLVKPEGAKRKITVQEALTFAYSDVKYTKYLILFK